MTIADIESINKNMLACADVAPLLGFDAQTREGPALLGFPVIVAGTRVQIFKEGFVHCLKFGLFCAMASGPILP